MVYQTVLSWDVGVIHLAYCLLTKKVYDNNKVNWEIKEWNIIDLTGRDEYKCITCNANATCTLGNKYYCKVHAKKEDLTILEYEQIYTKTNNKNKCLMCDKNGSIQNNHNEYFCSIHAKQSYNKYIKSKEIIDFQAKSSTKLVFDDVKLKLIQVLESKPELLQADVVVIENQPSFKNPRMKSIALTLYDYYLIRGIIDKERTGSTIKIVKFMSPSNKLKIADDGDSKKIVKAKQENNETKAYKLTKSLGIKYCLELASHLPNWINHFNSFKKKDDLADAFLQGAYYWTNNDPDEIKKAKLEAKEKKAKEKTIIEVEEGDIVV